MAHEAVDGGGGLFPPHAGGQTGITGGNRGATGDGQATEEMIGSAVVELDQFAGVFFEETGGGVGVETEENIGVGSELEDAGDTLFGGLQGAGGGAVLTDEGHLFLVELKVIFGELGELLKRGPAAAYHHGSEGLSIKNKGRHSADGFQTGDTGCGRLENGVSLGSGCGDANGNECRECGRDEVAQQETGDWKTMDAGGRMHGVNFRFWWLGRTMGKSLDSDSKLCFKDHPWKM